MHDEDDKYGDEEDNDDVYSSELKMRVRQLGGYSARHYKNKSNRVQTIDVFWLNTRVLVFESSFELPTFMFLELFCSNSAHF